MLVTHATQFLPRCDRVILLSKGEVIDQGPYDDVFERNPVFHGILKELLHTYNVTHFYFHTYLNVTLNLGTVHLCNNTVRQ